MICPLCSSEMEQFGWYAEKAYYWCHSCKGYLVKGVNYEEWIDWRARLN